jgi:hypothetical protein
MSDCSRTFFFYFSELSGQNRRRNPDDRNRAEVSVGSKHQLRVELNTNTNNSSNNLLVVNDVVAVSVTTNKSSKYLSPNSCIELVPLTDETCV